jgi:hypothetical protein
MKKLFNAAIYRNVMLSTFLFIGCSKQHTNVPENEAQLMSNRIMNTDMGFRINDEGLESQTLWELQQARAATARYRNINNAIKDGYSDLEIDIENMGHHFMKAALVDATFEIRKPEILVYNRDEDGNQQLVAVEYAVPINLSPNASPEGFTGSPDVWVRDEGFGLWLLHAWVWENNPDGVFNPTNPLVHLH